MDSCRFDARQLSLCIVFNECASTCRRGEKDDGDDDDYHDDDDHDEVERNKERVREKGTSNDRM